MYRTSEPDLFETVRARTYAAGDHCGVRVLAHDGADTVLPYRKFLGMSAWLGQRLAAAADAGTGTGQPSTVVIAASGPAPTLLAFFGALHAGLRPLILPTPTALGGREAFLTRIGQLVGLFRGDAVLALEQGLLPGGQRPPATAVVELATTADEYGYAECEPAAGRPRGDAVAFLQTTSASTGDSKLVAVSHANACANLTTLRTALRTGPDERFVTWLPLYHDMGLVGAALQAFFWAYPLHIMKPTDFIRRPVRWLDAVSRFRCTFTAAPNFGYDYAQRMVTDRELAGVDLSGLRRAAVGAEPIRLATLRGFYHRFRRYGLRCESLLPSYGMAESTLATTVAQPDTRPRYLVVDASGTTVGAAVRILGEGLLDQPSAVDGTGCAVFSVGAPLAGLELSLLDEEGRPLAGEGVLGEVALRGPSVAAGYLDPATAVPRPLSTGDSPAGGFPTGDLAFRHRGELFVLDRKKQVIIRNGQNFLATLLEDAVARIVGHPAHEVMVLDADIHDPASDIVVVVENHPGEPRLDPAQRAALAALELPVSVLLVARRRVIPRTTSGKKRYHECRRRIAAGDLPTTHVLRLADSR